MVHSLIIFALFEFWNICNKAHFVKHQSDIINFNWFGVYLIHAWQFRVFNERLVVLGRDTINDWLLYTLNALG